MKTRNALSDKLSQAELVLVALFRAAKGSQQKVAYEELVLQAWRDFPAEFSLRNHPEHPDASDIHKKLYQTLKPAGLVISLGNKNFRLTQKGVDRARELALVLFGPTHHQERAGDLARMTREDEAIVQHLLKSPAFQLWKTGEQAKLIDYDMKTFFQFSTNTALIERARRVEAAFHALTQAVERDIPNAKELKSLAGHLVDRFPELIGKE